MDGWVRMGIYRIPAPDVSGGFRHGPGRFVVSSDVGTREEGGRGKRTRARRRNSYRPRAESPPRPPRRKHCATSYLHDVFTPHGVATNASDAHQCGLKRYLIFHKLRSHKFNQLLLDVEFKLVIVFEIGLLVRALGGEWIHFVIYLKRYNRL